MAFLIYNTSNHLVLQDDNKQALLLTDTKGTLLGLMCCSFYYYIYGLWTT